jgi:release factor glutamine methyltransferase
MVARIVLEENLAEGRDVLDVFAGSGVLAVTAAVAGARSVTAVDISRRALLNVRLNAALNGVGVDTVRSDMLAGVAGRRFDLIVANPPYIPGPPDLPRRGLARAWEGGVDGRLLIDPLLSQAPEHLRPGGRLLVVHSSMNGEAETRQQLESAGLRTEVLVRHRGILGEVSRRRVHMLRERGLLRADQGEYEETLVIAGAAA